LDRARVVGDDPSSPPPHDPAALDLSRAQGPRCGRPPGPSGGHWGRVRTLLHEDCHRFRNRRGKHTAGQAIVSLRVLQLFPERYEHG
jgi:hypothetical protein